MVWPSRAERIARVADGWVARSSGTLDDKDIRERDAWRAADPTHEQAWQRAQALWTATGGIRRPVDRPATTRPQRRFQPAHALASLTVVIAAAGGAMLLERHLGHDRAVSVGQWVATANPSHVRLVDGTVVDLSPESAFSADFSGPIRSVLVSRGAARFDVAHDASRPFVVRAADRKVTAIGTRFEVALRPRGLVVTLFQGAIEVAANTPQRGPAPVRMLHGQRLTIEDGRQTMTRISATEPSTASRALDVDPTPVGFLIEQVNRTSTIPIRFADPALASRRVEGRFDIHDSHAFAEQLAAALDLAVTHVDGAYLLSSRDQVMTAEK